MAFYDSILRRLQNQVTFSQRIQLSKPEKLVSQHGFTSLSFPSSVIEEHEDLKGPLLERTIGDWCDEVAVLLKTDGPNTPAFDYLMKYAGSLWP